MKENTFQPCGRCFESGQKDLLYYREGVTCRPHRREISISVSADNGGVVSCDCNGDDGRDGLDGEDDLEDEDDGLGCGVINLMTCSIGGGSRQFRMSTPTLGGVVMTRLLVGMTGRSGDDSASIGGSPVVSIAASPCGISRTLLASVRRRDSSSSCSCRSSRI